MKILKYTFKNAKANKFMDYVMLEGKASFGIFFTLTSNAHDYTYKKLYGIYDTFLFGH